MKEIKFKEFVEADNSITLSANDFDIVVNGATKEKALELLYKDLEEYISEYNSDIEYWSKDKERRKAILLSNKL